MTTRAYYYGDGTDHIVHMTEAQAAAVMKFEITDMITDPETNEVFGTTNLSPIEIEHYSDGADILNAYVATHTVYWNDTSIPMLRPVE